MNNQHRVPTLLDICILSMEDNDILKVCEIEEIRERSRTILDKDKSLKLLGSHLDTSKYNTVERIKTETGIVTITTNPKGKIIECRYLGKNKTIYISGDRNITTREYNNIGKVNYYWDYGISGSVTNLVYDNSSIFIKARWNNKNILSSYTYRSNGEIYKVNKSD